METFYIALKNMERQHKSNLIYDLVSIWLQRSDLLVCKSDLQNKIAKWRIVE